MGKMSVGDAAYGTFGRYGVLDVRAGKVVKLSPTGQATVDFQERWRGSGEKRLRRFTANGGEIAGDGHLIDEAAFARLAKKQRATDAMRAVTDHLRSGSFRNKADLNAYMARLNTLAALVPDDESTAQPGPVL